jgi:hypothetical protein
MSPIEKLLTPKNGNDSKKDDDLLKSLDPSTIKGADIFMDIALKYPKEFEAYLNNLKSDSYANEVYNRLETAVKSILVTTIVDKEKGSTREIEGSYKTRKERIKDYKDKNSPLMNQLNDLTEDEIDAMRSETIVRQAADAAEVYGIIKAHEANIDLLKNFSKYRLDCTMVLTAKRLKTTDPRKVEALDQLTKLIDNLGSMYSTETKNELIKREEKLIEHCKERVEELAKVYMNEKELPKSFVSELEYWINIREKVTEPDREEIKDCLESIMSNELKASGLPEAIYDATKDCIK